MMDANKVGYFKVQKPSIWHRLGFHYPFDESLFKWRTALPSDGDWFVAGTLTTVVTVHLDFIDRIRVLFSGTCEVTCYTRTNVQIGRAESRSAFAVLKS